MAKIALLRPARKEDALPLAHIWFMSSHGILDYYFGSLSSTVSGPEIFQHLTSLEGNPFGFPRWQVAEVDGQVAGAVNAYTHEEEKALTDIPLKELVALGPRALFRFSKRSLALGDLLGLKIPGRIFSEMARDHLPNSLYLNCIGVLPEFQGLGLGSQLLDWSLETAKRKGTSSLSLHAWGDNHGAIALYQRFGFTLKRTFFPKLPPELSWHKEGKVFLVKQ